MAFKVRLFSDVADFEALHVAKLTNFPLEPRDYKPYSQVRICFAADGLHLQMLAFEANPLPESCITAVLAFPGKTPLTFTAYATGDAKASGAKPFIPLDIHPFKGEDLQGVFWGGNLFLAESVLRREGGFLPEPGAVFTGNFYKLCENPMRPHFGSYYPADFSRSLSDARNLGEFQVVDY